MEDNNRRRRQNEAPLPTTANQRYHQPAQNPQQQQQQQQTHRTMAGSSTERFTRPTPLNTSPPSAGRTGMGAGASGGYGAYYQDPATTSFSATTGMAQGAINYQHPQPTSGYAQDTRQSQGFAGSYNANMMYNVPQPSAPNTSVYDPPSNSFDMRQPAGTQIMPVDTNNFYGGESTNAAAATAMQQQSQPSTAQPAPVYQQGSGDNRTTMLNYSSNVPSMGSMAPQATSSVADVNMEESGEYQTNTDLNQAYTAYQEALKEVASNIKKGALAPAADSLHSVSEWLLSNVNDPGLTSDDQSLHSDRIKLWNDFNHAWLGVFQKQKDLLEEGSQRTQSLIPQEKVQSMVDNLIRHCDNIERYGLVDYQYGVWEERIVAVVEECLDLQTQGATAGPSR